MALRFICDACKEEVKDRLMFVRAPHTHTNQILAETHEICFLVYLEANYKEWLTLFGIFEVGTQHLNGGTIRPGHRIGTLL